MKRMTLFILLTIVCLLADVEASPNDFWDGIKESFNKFWTAVRRPVKIRRLGNTGKLKSTTESTTTTTTRRYVEFQPINNTEAAERTTTRYTEKLTIPTLFLKKEYTKESLTARPMKSETLSIDQIVTGVPNVLQMRFNTFFVERPSKLRLPVITASRGSTSSLEQLKDESKQ